MTSHKLYAILTFLDDLDNELELQRTLDVIRKSLSSLASQPSQAQQQMTLASALAAFEKAAGKLGDLISPAQYALIEGMGGGDFFEPSIAEKIRAAVQTNAMTPSVASDFVEELTSRRAAFLSTVRDALKNLQSLNITTSAIEPGSADITFLIPRHIFDNELERFAKELKFISRLFRDFSEALTGEPQHVSLEELSSSIPTVALVAGVGVISAIAHVVNKFLEAWERIERIRKMRAELSEMGLKGAALNELSEQITTTVNEVVEETTEKVLASYPGPPSRRNELGNAIRQDTRRLFGQIERGLKIEFRAEPQESGEAKTQQGLKDISDLARSMKFPEIAQEPMLLKGDEMFEGQIEVENQIDVVKVLKKTKTERTTVIKKKIKPQESEQQD